MRLKDLYITIILLVFSASSLGSSLSVDSKRESKKTWLLNMQKNLPALLCQKDHYLVQCYETNESACVETTSLLVKTCLSNVEQNLPDQLSPQHVTHWGQIVGRCSFDIYKKMMTDKKRTTPACAEPPSSLTPTHPS